MIGREVELAAGRRHVDAVASGPACLVIDGEPGIGKSTLWREVVASAAGRGQTVLASRPAAAEAKLAFAGLADLLGELPAELFEALPAPQRRALDVALLRGPADGSAPERRAVFAALSSVLSLLADDRPVLIAIDDVQWLDRPTLAAVEFALRRFGRRRIGLMLAVRTGDGALLPAGFLGALHEAGAERIALGPLSVAALHDIIAERTGRAFARPVLVRIARAVRGNPFYALEIAAEIARRGEPPAGEALPIPALSSGLALARIDRLSGAGREALLTAAALSRPTRERFDAATLGELERAGLVAVANEVVSFVHPLFASAVYGAASPADRRNLHRRLAGLAGDPEERARHLALAADGPDPRIAEALDLAAARAAGRGAPEASAELLELALRLTGAESADHLAARRLAAAEQHFRAGDLARARSYAESVLADAPAGPARGNALRILGEIRYHDDSFAEAVPLFLEALQILGDDPRAVGLHVDLAYALVNLGDLVAAADHGRAAVERQVPGDDGSLAIALAASVIVDFYLGRPLDRDRLDRALALEDPDRQVVMPMRPSLIAAIVLHLVDEIDEAVERMAALRERAIERGEESDLPLVAAHLSMFERRRGRPAAALAFATEGLEIARTTGSRTAQVLLLAERCFVLATRGDVLGARRDAEEAARLASEHHAGFGGLWLRWALASLELSLGDAERTVELLEPVLGIVEARGGCDPIFATFLPDGVEALVLTGSLDRAERLADLLAASGHAQGRASSLAAAARSTALIRAASGDLAAALKAAEDAVDHGLRAGLPLETGRARLVLGQVQRRMRRKAAARESLDQAVATFEAADAPLWADRAREESARTGTRHAPSGALTPTERLVADLAAQGLTNRRIAEALFLSPKTVEANLARIYMKLDIRSRAELGRVVAERATATLK